jgi:hypothetical protein
MRRRSEPTVYPLPALPLLFIALIAQTASLTASTRHWTVDKVIPVVEGLKKKLHITNAIEIKIVDDNPLGLSVEPVDHRRDVFLLRIDGHLLNRLDSQELKAAIAHELGHVWIYTHHPYLQTEALANQIAMRAVNRDAFKKLYTELWSFKGSPGNIQELLGTEPAPSKSAADKH